MLVNNQIKLRKEEFHNADIIRTTLIGCLSHASKIWQENETRNVGLRNTYKISVGEIRLRLEDNI
jgi:hypothetical protein